MSNKKFYLKIHDKRQGKLKRGFSLVELLCVIAIISILGSLSWPSIVGIISGDQLTNNVYQMSGLAQQARTIAMTQHTYVWLGFYSYTKDGSPAITVAMVSGNSGLSTDLLNNNYRLSSKLVTLKNVTLAAPADYSGLPGLDTTDNTDVASQPYTFAMNIPGTALAKFGDVITFGPDGQASLTQITAVDTNFHLVQCVGLGLNLSPSKKLRTAAIQVHGLCGEVSVFRQ
jgi:prepilin-type N-terminal cleavage/methylation domain-containing protein